MLKLNLQLKQIDGSANNPEISSTMKIEEHIPCGYSMSIIWAFDNIENKHTLYHRKDCLKKFCTSLREHATNAINFEKKANVTINKNRAKTTLRCDRMLHLWKKIPKKVC